ncbi:MAG: hypothetical protein NVSMB27_49860 [Ktedonobacteraceae bacterium]
MTMLNVCFLALRGNQIFDIIPIAVGRSCGIQLVLLHIPGVYDNPFSTVNIGL